MAGIRDKFRRRYFSQIGWAGSINEEIPNTPMDRAENVQTQNKIVRDKIYSPGRKPRLRKRVLGR